MEGGNGKSEKYLGQTFEKCSEGKILIGRFYFNILYLKEEYYV